MLDFMSVGDEPIDGYKLQQDLGGTVFYRQWKVRSPDGSLKMWKTIDLVVGNAAVETRNLKLLVQLRHPYLNTLTNFWNINDNKLLVVETEVPLFSLKQRLEECKKQGQKGIPADELLEYLTQAAEGLDFLNSPRHDFDGKQVAVYHRDLRPDALLIFQEDGKFICKVSDFGLAKPVTDQVAQHSQGLQHYDYDPPEFYEGQTAPTSDQYSFAINYYELRTGELPFRGTMLEQLQARLNDAPNLTALPEAERAILKKALSRDVNKRYASCLEMVQALKAASKGGGVAPAAAAPAAPRQQQPGVMPGPGAVRRSAAGGAGGQQQPQQRPGVSRPAPPRPAGVRTTPPPPAARQSGVGGPPARPPAGRPPTPARPAPTAGEFSMGDDPGPLPPRRQSAPPQVDPDYPPMDAGAGSDDFELPPSLANLTRGENGEDVVKRSSGRPANVRDLRQQLKASEDMERAAEAAAKEAAGPEEKKIPVIWVFIILIFSVITIYIVFNELVTGGTKMLKGQPGATATENP